MFLEATTVGGKDVELWTIQIGARPGRDYLLLSRSPGEELIKSFDVLQTDCPDANVRAASTLDTLRTDYCAMNTREELVEFARHMAARPLLGTLTHVADSDV